MSTLSVLFGSTATLVAAITPLAALGLLVFCLLYTPCIAAIASVKRELGGRWALGIVGQLGVAWVAAFAVRGVGLSLERAGVLTLALGAAVAVLAVLAARRLARKRRAPRRRAGLRRVMRRLRRLHASGRGRGRGGGRRAGAVGRVGSTGGAGGAFRARRGGGAWVAGLPRA